MMGKTMSNLRALPLIVSQAARIDHCVMVAPFSAEKTLTKDTVPVDVDAVIFWVVWDAEKAALEVENHRAAIAWAAQTALREIIAERTIPWGITVRSVEIRAAVIPQGLEDAMSRQAQAERERQARVILGESEKQISTASPRQPSPDETIPPPSICAP
jgi:regulator of protease activity HflC (stomatin/prohibitin superfamily)